MIALTEIANPENFAVRAFLIFKLLNRKEFTYKQKRPWKFLKK